MKRILLIKLTSLGDLIHALPAITDAYQAYPDLKVDWVIDENFSEVATWHPAVDKIYKTNHRKWRHGLIAALRPIVQLVKSVRQADYDLIIDGQGNFKTAFFSLLMRNPTAGYDLNSVREPIASFGYLRKFTVSRKAHAVDRLRQLFALSLDYPCPTTAPNFSIDQGCFVKPCIALPSSYLFFVHNASWVNKLWPEEHWKKLIQMATAEGYQVLLPWGNSSEKARAERLALNKAVTILPRLSLSEIGYVLARADACVCMDTGFSHLAAALNIPAVTLYGATDSGLIGASGKNQLYIQSNLPCAPCNKKECRFPAPPASLNPPCLASLTPERIMGELQNIIPPQSVEESGAGKQFLTSLF
jgi:lipopolysaccharide heptosyltransferase I